MKLRNQITPALLTEKRQRIDLKVDGHILFLEKGTVSVYRVENDTVTVSISAPAILRATANAHRSGRTLFTL